MQLGGRLQKLLAYVPVVLVVLYNLFSGAMFDAVSLVAGAHDAGLGHSTQASAPSSERAAPASHCHPGIDCFVTTAILPNEAHGASGAGPSARRDRAELGFRSVTLSPRPPPPRGRADQAEANTT